MKNNPRKIFECRREEIDYTQCQKKALLLIEHFLDSPELFFLLSGNAGTGKTTIAENIATYAHARMLAPTNAAIQRLKDKFECDKIPGEKFATIHATLYGAPDPETGEFIKKEGLRKAKVYIVDEASMIDNKVFEDLIEEAKKEKVKLIFLGDDFQLEPVGKDPLIFDWEDAHPNIFSNNWKIKLTEVRRNEGSVLKVATHLREALYPEILNLDEEDFEIVPRFSADIRNDIKDDENYVILVSTNKTRMNYNAHVRKVRFEEEAQNFINDGERVISVANQQFLNGEQYVIRHPKIIQGGCFEENVNTGSKKYPKWKTIKAYLIEHEVEGMKGSYRTLFIPDLDMPSLHAQVLMYNRDIYQNRYLTQKGPKWRMWDPKVNIATYGYATSVHKSQGNEWDKVYIDCDWLSDNWNKSRWLYTAVTRAKKRVEIKQSNQFQLVDG